MVILFLASCRNGGTAVTTGHGDATPTVVVEVDVFSGVPNPEWTLDAASAARLTTLVSHLTPAPNATPPPDSGLGFRGFVVRGLGVGSAQASPGAEATLRVRGVDVVVTSGDRRVLFTDPGHEVYTLLRDLALDHVPDEIAAHIPPGGLHS
jgi:hypothetical protein